MTHTSEYPTEHELHAYIDGELGCSRHAEIAAILREDPALAARVAAFESDREQLRAALGRIAEEPLPAAWAARIEVAMAPAFRIVPATSPEPAAEIAPAVAPVVAPNKIVTTRRFALASGIALAASVAVAVRWRAGTDDTILTEAQAAREGRLDGRLPGGDPLPSPASRDALLQSTLGMAVRAPALEKFGFRLAGMELFARPAGGAAQLRYADAGQRGLTIYVRPSDGTVKFDIIRQGETHVCVWQDDVVGAVITASVSAAEMLRIASSAYTSLNL